MQITCKISMEGSDVRCPVCGQGFLVFWEGCSTGARQAQRKVIAESLRSHHALGASHPSAAFPVQPWDGDASLSPAALEDQAAALVL
jgi:hypothetical protein